MRIGIVSGGFDPLHKGHIDYIKAAAKRCEWLVVGCNSDEWLQRKKGRAFLQYEDRAAIIASLDCVDRVIPFNDDCETAFNLIEKVYELYPSKDEIIFMNGGDRTKENIPEEVMCEQFGIDCTFLFGVGGENKANSSSWILEDWSAPKVKRPWGYYRVIHKGAGFVVKELTIEPGKSLSNQWHEFRDEVWNVVQGDVEILTKPRKYAEGKDHRLHRLGVQETLTIPKETWHKASNPSTTTPAKVVEIWYGNVLDESDITREEVK